MSDFADDAGELTARAEALGILNVRNKLAPSGVTECEDCDNPILAERLEVLPSATRCLPCQELFDMEAGRHV